MRRSASGAWSVAITRRSRRGRCRRRHGGRLSRRLSRAGPRAGRWWWSARSPATVTAEGRREDDDAEHDEEERPEEIERDLRDQLPDEEPDPGEQEQPADDEGRHPSSVVTTGPPVRRWTRRSGASGRFRCGCSGAGGCRPRVRPEVLLGDHDRHDDVEQDPEPSDEREEGPGDPDE